MEGSLFLAFSRFALWGIYSHYSQILSFSEDVQHPSRPIWKFVGQLAPFPDTVRTTSLSVSFDSLRDPFGTFAFPIVLSLSTSLRVTGAYFLVFTRYLTLLHTTDTYLHLSPMDLSIRSLLHVPSERRSLAFLAVLMDFPTDA